MTLVLVSEQTAHALLSVAEWWQARRDDPIWPIPASRLASRARVAQLEIEDAFKLCVALLVVLVLAAFGCRSSDPVCASAATPSRSRAAA